MHELTPITIIWIIFVLNMSTHYVKLEDNQLRIIHSHFIESLDVIKLKFKYTCIDSLHLLYFTKIRKFDYEF